MTWEGTIGYTQYICPISLWEKVSLCPPGGLRVFVLGEEIELPFSRTKSCILGRRGSGSREHHQQQLLGPMECGGSFPERGVAQKSHLHTEPGWEGVGWMREVQLEERWREAAGWGRGRHQVRQAPTSCGRPASVSGKISHRVTREPQGGVQGQLPPTRPRRPPGVSSAKERGGAAARHLAGRTCPPTLAGLISLDEAFEANEANSEDLHKLSFSQAGSFSNTAEMFRSLKCSFHLEKKKSWSFSLV